MTCIIFRENCKCINQYINFLSKPFFQFYVHNVEQNVDTTEVKMTRPDDYIVE